MKKVILFFVAALFMLLVFSDDEKQIQGGSGFYLGLEPPDELPRIFAPGIVSTRWHVYGNVTFDRSLRTACWTPNSEDPECPYRGGLIISRLQNHAWTPPVEIAFMNELYAHRSPFFSTSEDKLYFQAHLKAVQGWDQQERFYYVERKADGWSEPALLDAIFDKYMVHWQFSLDFEKNIYFGGELRGSGKPGGIYCSRFQNGKYLEPELILGNDAFPDFVFGPAISPKGDYLLFTRLHPRESKNPRAMSVYATFRGKDSLWSEPRELGKLMGMEGNQVRISPDGKYILFVRNDGMCWWVSARIVEKLRRE